MRALAKKILYEKIGWYPVTTFGWILTILYTALLIYVVIKVNTDLYGTEESFFYVSTLSVFIIIVVLSWARMRGEKPFLKTLKT